MRGDKQEQALEKQGEGYLKLLEEYEKELQFEQQRVILRHNLHKMVNKELKARGIQDFVEEARGK